MEQKPYWFCAIAVVALACAGVAPAMGASEDPIQPEAEVPALIAEPAPAERAVSPLDALLDQSVVPLSPSASHDLEMEDPQAPVVLEGPTDEVDVEAMEVHPVPLPATAGAALVMILCLGCGTLLRRWRRLDTIEA